VDLFSERVIGVLEYSLRCHETHVDFGASLVVGLLWSTCGHVEGVTSSNLGRVPYFVAMSTQLFICPGELMSQ